MHWNKFKFFLKINDFKQQLDNLQDRLDKKVNESELLENELNQLKEFRKKKIQMQKELEEVIYFFNFISK